MEDTRIIQFKPLEKSDFELLTKWLNMDFVTKWYEKRKFTYDDVERKFGPRVEKSVPTESYIIQMDHTPIGYIQTYRIKDYPKYASCVRVGDQTAGMDMFIGEKDYIHKGLGKDIIRQFLQQIIFRKQGIEHCMVGPEPDNRSAIRAYEKAGFRYVKTVQCEGEKEPEYIMTIDKPKEHIVFRLDTNST